jgi:hypothetical protein
MLFFGATSGSTPPEACGRAALLRKVLGPTEMGFVQHDDPVEQLAA